MAKRTTASQYTSKQNMERDRHGLYVVGSLAVQQAPAPKAEPRRKQPQIHVVRPKRKVQTKAQPQVNFVTKFALTCFVLAVLACGLLLVNKLAMIAQNNSMIAQKEAELENLTRYGEQLEVELAMSQDLNSVMVTAQNELGMSAPQQQMRREVVLGAPAGGDNTQLAQQDEQSQSGIMAMLGKITELLH